MQVSIDDKEMNISLSMSIRFTIKNNNKKIKYKYIKGKHYENSI